MTVGWAILMTAMTATAPLVMQQVPATHFGSADRIRQMSWSMLIIALGVFAIRALTGHGRDVAK